MSFSIRSATLSDLDIVTSLALLLWPGHDIADLRAEMAGFLKDEQARVLLAQTADSVIGFAQCGLRHDYVEGTDTSPVGYLEGIYVREGHRRSGVAAGLLAAAEAWAKERGCKEFASDCELDNELSIAFHLGAGFTEANRLVCFAKEL